MQNNYIKTELDAFKGRRNPHVPVNQRQLFHHHLCLLAPPPFYISSCSPTPSFSSSVLSPTAPPSSPHPFSSSVVNFLVLPFNFSLLHSTILLHLLLLLLFHHVFLLLPLPPSPPARPRPPSLAWFYFCSSFLHFLLQNSKDSSRLTPPHLLSSPTLIGPLRLQGTCSTCWRGVDWSELVCSRKKVFLFDFLGLGGKRKS